MSPFRLIPPDGSDWSIDAKPTETGVILAIGFELAGQPVTAQFALDRAQARQFADGVLRAAGDGTMRTFPHPQIPEA